MNYTKQFTYILIVVCLIILPGCQNGCLKGQGKTISQTRSIDSFSALEVDGWVDVVLEQGSAPEVEVISGKNLIGNIRTEVNAESGKLMITNNNKCHWSRGGSQPTVRVKYQTLAQIDHLGFGNILSVDTLRNANLLVNIKGNGNVKLLVNVTNFSCTMLELGDLEVHGKSERSNLFSHNVGFFKGKNFVTTHCTARTRDEGQFEVTVLDSLVATVESTGDIIYYGNPSYVKSNVTGPGRVVAGK
ncbi:GIN domain-containing protein [Microscilla marina]|uniref:GIN domain-containing protein n=1 Tax=Microscilla marina TaxID=1027 RepID=UPI0005D473DA|nr:DUF2807 domain-containing protein [Microscilla marina]